MWVTRGAALWFLMASATALAQPAPGQPYDKEHAKALYAEGLRHYNVAEYDQAIESFKSSYLVSGDARLLFNVAQAYRLKGDCEQALRFYKNFQRENPDPNGENAA
jgi:tetratricopeptide (TPR) repeat protein